MWRVLQGVVAVDPVWQRAHLGSAHLEGKYLVIIYSTSYSIFCLLLSHVTSGTPYASIVSKGHCNPQSHQSGHGD